MNIIQNRWFAAVSSAFACFGVVVFSIVEIELYGWSLFLGLPLVSSLLASFMYCFRQQRSFGQAYLTGLLSILALGSFVLLLALDGLICLLMALPLALIVAVLGAGCGQIMARSLSKRYPGVPPTLIFLLLPMLVAFEHKTASPVPPRKVTTSIVIQGDVSKVWQAVIAFPKIQHPPTGPFKLGIAYPIEARIEGSGAAVLLGSHQ